MFSRLKPIEAEAGVLGGIITKNDLLSKVNLTAGDFHDLRHQAVFQAMEALAEKAVPIDEVTLRAELQRRPQGPGFEVTVYGDSGDSYIDNLALRCPTTDNTLHYADIVREAAELRRLQVLGSTVAMRVEAGDDVRTLRELLSTAVRPLRELATTSTLAELQPVQLGGLETGLGLESVVPGGLPRDKVTTLYGETATFKTTIKNHVLFHLAASGRKVLDVSLEDSSQLTWARYVARKHGLPYGQLSVGVVEAPPLDDEDRRVLGNIFDGGSLVGGFEEILKEAEAIGVDAVFVDYIQLIEGCTGDHAALAEVMRKAQLEAKEKSRAFIFLSQVKQDVDARSHLRDKAGNSVGDPRPRINDCLGSSSLRTHSKLGLGLFRPWNYCKVPTRSSGPFGDYCLWINNWPGGVEAAMKIYENTLEIIVGKSVLGPSGVSKLVLVDPPTGLISEHPWEKKNRV